MREEGGEHLVRDVVVRGDVEKGVREGVGGAGETGERRGYGGDYGTGVADGFAVNDEELFSG